MGRNRRHESDRGKPRGRVSSNESTRASGPLDRFTEVDDLLRDVNDTLDGVDRTIGALAEALDEQTELEVELPVRNELPLVADATIEPNAADGADFETDNRESVDLTVPRDGRVTRVFLAFPNGANQSIGIGVVGVDGEQLIPFGPANVNFIALDDKTVEFELDYPVQKGETVTVNFINAREAEEEGEVETLTAFASSIVTITED